MEITATHLELYESAGAPEAFLAWAREESRTYGKLATTNTEWALWIAQCGCAPEGVLSFLKSNPNWEVRMAVALNAETEKVLNHLLKDKEPMVRAALAENVNLPNGIVDALQQDPEELVSQTAKFFWPAERSIPVDLSVAAA
jgi:hypothetical protein